MTRLVKLTAALVWQRRRLRELIEISGKLDPDHPLQAYSLQRIAWLEDQIARQKNRRK